jgi:hypothetical protein
MAFLVATPISAKKRSEIQIGEVWHYSKATPGQIMTAKLAGGAGSPNATIRLSPPTGFQWDFWKFVRDASVFDPDTFNPVDRGRYLYFFLGKPGFMARITNVQKAPLTIRIPGADLLGRVPTANLFSREEFGTIIIVRGDYVGPAVLDPAPP